MLNLVRRGGKLPAPKPIADSFVLDALNQRWKVFTVGARYAVCRRDGEEAWFKFDAIRPDEAEVEERAAEPVPMSEVDRRSEEFGG